MTVFKCKMCGGTIEIEQGTTVGICDCCGTKQTFPRLDDDRRANLYDRANHFRRNNEFDKAAGIYEQILNEDTGDAEAYWSLVLCRYGIEYVEDPATHKRVPTVNRAQFTSIFDDDNYKSAIKFADGYQESIYEEEANTINEIQKGILAISQKEDPFDVFICYKETDNYGKRTYDSVLANDLYHQLTQEGFKVFFARITLEDKLGSAYEPYIFAALNSAKVMVVLGTKPEYFNAVWVKNEWSRYLTLVRESGGKKTLIPAYRDMDPYDLPEEFSHLQAQDMNKLGFMQDLIRGITKIVRANDPKPAVRETVIVGGNTAVEPLLKRTFMFLEDGDWNGANGYCEKVLDLEPENGQAYLGKLMAELHVHRQEELADCAQPFDYSNNYQKAIRFGDENLANVLHGYINSINERKENERLTGIYNSALTAMKSSNTEARFKAVAKTFKTISGFKDSDVLSMQCLDRAETCKKNEIYDQARASMAANSIDGFETAIKIFSTISGWRDADKQLVYCQNAINELRLKEESDRLERERLNQERQIANQRAAQKFRKISLIVSIAVVVCIIFVVVLIAVIIPQVKLNEAMSLVKNGKYEEGYARLDEMGKSELIKQNKYERALEQMESGHYDEALDLLDGLNYKDSEKQIEKCMSAINDDKYVKALYLLKQEKYDEAYAILNGLGKQDVISKNKQERAEALIKAEKYDEAYALLEEIGKKDLIAENKYERALALIDAKKYAEAINLLNGLNFRDSEEKIAKCRNEIKDSQYGRAMELIASGDYEAAYAILEEIGRHDAVTENKYDRAMSLMSSGKYSDAYALLLQIESGYKDSDKKIEECIFRSQVAKNKNYKVGSTIKFGLYEQDNNTANGKEEIEWIVLKVRDGKALVISKYLLDTHPYNNSVEDVTWRNSSLRKWLNSTFYNNAFSSYHKQLIEKTNVEAAKNSDYEYSTQTSTNTNDHIYVLSYSAISNYMKSESARRCEATEYCRAKEGFIGNIWWLRTSGSNNQKAVVVDESGYMNSSGKRVETNYCIRPIMWIKISG